MPERSRRSRSLTPKSDTRLSGSSHGSHHGTGSTRRRGRSNTSKIHNKLYNGKQYRKNKARENAPDEFERARREKAGAEVRRELLADQTGPRMLGTRPGSVTKVDGLFRPGEPGSEDQWSLPFMEDVKGALGLTFK